MLNINREVVPLKTELVAVLAEENIQAEHLVFRYTLDLASIKNLQLVLVDHNGLKEEDEELESKVVEIIDHHV
jgi:inorganic pyrophosphatase/exopolyphosphatase